MCVVRWVVSPPESPRWSRRCPFALASSVKCRAATGRRVASTAYLASNELLLPIQAIGRTACTSSAPLLSQRADRRARLRSVVVDTDAKNSNAEEGKKVWRYHAYNSYTPMAQKLSTMKATLKKVLTPYGKRLPIARNGSLAPSQLELLHEW